MSNRTFEPTQRVVKATETQRVEYAATGAVYPLYGYIQVGEHQCPVEDLRGSWGPEDPSYEVLAPDGYHWGNGEWTRSLLGFSLKDIAARATGAGIDEGDPQ
jgi:hypothetical protein